MKAQNNKIAEIPRHLEDDDLISFLDGELLPGEQEYARGHIESCWSCRSRLNATQSSIENFMRLREQRLMPDDLMPSGPALELFRQRLVQHSSAARAQTQFRLSGARLHSLLKGFGLLFKSRMSALADSPAAIRLAVMLFVGGSIVALVIVSSRVTTVSASEFIQRATQAQAHKINAHAQPVIHQKVRVRRRAPSSAGEASVNWEIWNDRTNARFRHSTAEADGRRASGEAAPAANGRSQNQTAAHPLPDIIVDLQQVLRSNNMDPRQPLSAASYQSWRNSLAEKQEEVTRSGLTGGGEALTLRTKPVGDVSAGRIAEAALVVRERDWLPIEQRLRVKGADADYEFTLTETAFEVLSLATVGPEVFADGGTISHTAPASKTATPEPAATPASNLDPDKTNLVPPSARPVASAGLEVEVLNLLDQTGASLGGQVSVSREASGLLRVHGIVEDEARKREVAEALAPVSANPAVRVEVFTVAEALKRQSQAKNSATPRNAEAAGPQEVAITENRFPVQDELESYFAHQSGLNSVEGASSDRTVSSEIRSYSGRVRGRSRKALLHAWALRRLAERFSPSELETLDQAARDKWRSMIRSHARSLQSETEGLRRDLQPVFYRSLGAGRAQSGAAINSDAELVRAIQTLFAAVSAQEKAISRAFTVSQSGEGGTAIKAEQFWLSLRNAEALAASIQASN